MGFCRTEAPGIRIRQLEKRHSTGYWLVLLLAISATGRALLAGRFCLGNDEAYYYTYALYPGLSHFDHPPMVGWFIQIFTLNLRAGHEFFIRLGAVAAGTASTFLMYAIGRELGTPRTGLKAALLHTASVYGSLIAGLMMLPDAPQTVFWLAAVLFLLKSLPAYAGEKYSRSSLLLAAVFIGLGLLSKYTTAYLYAGMMLYILLYNRKWLRTKELYLAHFIMLLFALPIIVWNAQHGFVSFTFHGSRVGIGGQGLQLTGFLTELAGELLYTNPVNFLITVLAAAAFFSKRNFFENRQLVKLLLLSSLPLIATFWMVSLFRHTLPHWPGPAYMTLIPVAALWLDGRRFRNQWLLASGGFLLLLLGLSVAQIETGFIPLDKWFGNARTGRGEKDISLELYGWRQLRKEAIPLFDRYENAGMMQPASPIVTYRWFPAGNYSYYLARGTNRVVLAAGDTSEIHKYVWIDQAEGGFSLNTDAWYITSSRDYRHPSAMRTLYYEKILPPDTIPVFRMNEPAYYFYVYRLKNLQSKR